MKFHLGLLGVILLITCSPVLAQGPDTTYVRIYQMIQDADSLRERGQDQPAIARYQDVLTELDNFRVQFPTWNQNIINYRLNYVRTKLAGMGVAEPVPTPDPSPGEVKAPDQTPGPTSEQLQQLQAQIETLNQQNNLLNQKLKEAWAAQPTLLDPRQLAQAEDRIRQLEKERDLLLVTLDTQPPPAPPVEAALLRQEQAVLAQVRQELASQKLMNDNLQRENVTLKQQVTELQQSRVVQPIPEGDLSTQYAQAQADMGKLKADNIALRTEQIMMETRLADMTKALMDKGSGGSNGALQSELKETKSLLKDTTKERDRLTKQLASANRRLERRAEDSAAERELILLQARLDVLEAQAVPFSQEELALINHQSGVEMVATTTEPVAVTNRVHELPPGAGPLMAQARRAIEAGRFEEAETKLMEILRQDEDNVPTLFSLGMVLMDLNRPGEAEPVLKKALAVDAQDPGCNFLLGILKYKQDKYDEALDALSISAKYDSARPETQFYLGRILMAKGNRGPAETAFRKAIQLRPGWGDAHYELAVVYATQTPPFKELAEWHYQKAISGGTPRNFNFEKLLEAPE